MAEKKPTRPIRKRPDQIVKRQKTRNRLNKGMNWLILLGNVFFKTMSLYLLLCILFELMMIGQLLMRWV